MDEVAWGTAVAEGGHQAEVPLGHPGVPPLVSELDSEVAEEAGSSLILNTG